MNKLGIGDKIAMIGIIIASIFSLASLVVNNDSINQINNDITNNYEVIYNNNLKQKDDVIKKLDKYKYIKIKADYFKVVVNDFLLGDNSGSYENVNVDYLGVNESDKNVFVYFAVYRDEKWDPSYGIGLMFSKIDNSVDYFLAELDKDSISNESYDENRVLLHYITDCMIFSLLDKKDCNRVVIELPKNGSYVSDNYTYYHGTSHNGYFDNGIMFSAFSNEFK